MDKLIVTTVCDDGSCCCLTLRATVGLVSIFSMIGCVAELLSRDVRKACCSMQHYVESFRLVLMWFFHIANVLAFLSTVAEVRLLVDIYVWYTLGFILMGFIVALLELLLASHEGAKGFVSFAVEVMFLFVLSRCLPVVNTYANYLERVILKVPTL